MKTILYVNKKEIRQNLINVVQTQITGISIRICHSITDLSHMLRKPLHEVSVLILFITSRKELKELNLMTFLFDNIRIILILPDSEKSTVSLCIGLQPSFISYVDADLMDIASVLKQIQKIQRR